MVFVQGQPVGSEAASLKLSTSCWRNLTPPPGSNLAGLPGVGAAGIIEHVLGRAFISTVAFSTPPQDPQGQDAVADAAYKQTSWSPPPQQLFRGMLHRNELFHLPIAGFHDGDAIDAGHGDIDRPPASSTAMPRDYQSERCGPPPGASPAEISQPCWPVGG